MNLFDEIKALFAIKRAVDNVREEQKVKPGWKTTEFWMTIATNVVTVAGALKGLIPDDKAALIVAIANAVYGVARALTKATADTPDAAAPAAPAK